MNEQVEMGVDVGAFNVCECVVGMQMFFMCYASSAN